MKKMLLLAGAFVATGLMAQPTLTFSVTDELIQSTPTFNIGDAVNEGPSGANQIWDFSGAAFPQTQINSFDVPTNTPFASSYPNSDFVGIAAESFGTSYVFYNVEADGVYLEGFEIEGLLSQTYSNSRKDLSSPMQYLDSYTDQAVFETVSSGLTSEGTTDFSLVVDGYGTLFTPSGSYPNVLRVHTVENTDLVFDIGIGPPIVTSTTLDSYAWMIDGYPLPILLTFTQTSDGQPDSGGARYISGVPLLTTEFNNLKGVNLYPVPAVDFVNLDLGDNQAGAATVKIFDIRGVVIKEFTQTLAQITRFDVADLPSGFYSINIQTDEGMVTKHFTK